MRGLLRRSALLALTSVIAAVSIPYTAGAAQEPVQEPEPKPGGLEADIPNPAKAVPATLGVQEARAAIDEAMGFLVESQNPDGSWGSSSIEGVLEIGFSVETYYAWQFAAHGLAVLALADADATPEVTATLDRAIDWLVTARIPQRGSDWDVDAVWSALYGFTACTRIATDERFIATEGAAQAIDERGRAFWAVLERNEVPSGGWAYYDDPPYTRRPKWATSFCTALVLPSLVTGQELGWIESDASLERAKAALMRCILPNGAYTYDASRAIPRVPMGEHINDVRGSLGRIQAGNWALAMVGEPTITPERIREGLDEFFQHHKYLDVARMRPIPHEAYHANAGYFYLFGHMYAGLLIELLPADQREAYHAKLRPHLIKIQRSNGSMVDFIGTSYTVTAGTAMGAIALQAGLPPRD